VNVPQKKDVVSSLPEEVVGTVNAQAPLVVVEELEVDLRDYKELDLVDEEEYVTNEELPEIHFSEEEYDEKLLASLALEAGEEEDYADDHTQTSSFTYALLTYLDGTQRAIKVKGVYEEVTLDYDIDIMNDNKSILLDAYTGTRIEIEPEHLKRNSIQ
jgi:hypothetical protein